MWPLSSRDEAGRKAIDILGWTSENGDVLSPTGQRSRLSDSRRGSRGQAVGQIARRRGRLIYCQMAGFGALEDSQIVAKTLVGSQNGKYPAADDILRAEVGRLPTEVRGETILFRLPYRIRSHLRRALLMRCPVCKNDETKVIDSRTSQDFSIRRRRECLDCSRRFTTYERIEESPIKVIKKDGTRIPFDRTRIRSGIEKACYKRPISNEQIDQVVANVEASIYEDGLREVPSRQIGELVFNALRELDKVAFVRFASVYREFKDVNDFVDELQPMLDNRDRG